MEQNSLRHRLRAMALSARAQGASQLLVNLLLEGADRIQDLETAISQTLGFIDDTNLLPTEDCRDSLRLLYAVISATNETNSGMILSPAQEVASQASENIETLIVDMLEGDHDDNEVSLGRLQCGKDEIQVRLSITRRRDDFIDDDFEDH